MGVHQVRSRWRVLLIASAVLFLSLFARAGQPTAKIALTPMPARVGEYPPGTTIIGQEIAADAGGFRVWLEWQVSGWDPDGNDILDGTGICTGGVCTAGRIGRVCTTNTQCDQPTLSVWQGGIDGSGFLDADTDFDGDPSDDGDQADIQLALEACPVQGGDHFCGVAFGIPWGKCFPAGAIPGCTSSCCCSPIYYAKWDSRPDNICAGVSCQADCSIGGLACFAAAESPAVLHDDGTIKYGGFVILDIPADAKGRYTVRLNELGSALRTFMSDRQSPPQDIPVQKVGFSVFIRTGRCCYALGTPDAGCTEGVLGSECGDDEPGPFLFTVGLGCPPDGTDCSLLGACCDRATQECTDDVLENDCQGAGFRWSHGAVCPDVECPPFGACCDLVDGTCLDDTQEVECDDQDHFWFQSLTCAASGCAGRSGACCNQETFTGFCIDDTIGPDCTCTGCRWYEDVACADLGCTRAAIPAVSDWGLVILTLSLLAGAKIVFNRR